jgi:hypothetical protein
MNDQTYLEKSTTTIKICSTYLLQHDVAGCGRKLDEGLLGYYSIYKPYILFKN